jgi:hypothetical protein
MKPIDAAIAGQIVVLLSCCRAAEVYSTAAETSPVCQQHTKLPYYVSASSIIAATSGLSSPPFNCDVICGAQASPDELGGFAASL